LHRTNAMAEHSFLQKHFSTCFKQMLASRTTCKRTLADTLFPNIVPGMQ